jgi:hypothetical protein
MKIVFFERMTRKDPIDFAATDSTMVMTQAR